MDDRDRRILEALRADAWLSYAELAVRVHLSASAVQRRVEKLIESAHYVAGEADVVVALRVSDVPEYARFVDERLNADPRVRRFRTLTSLRQLL